jgi:5'-nucleotidase
MHMLLTNDDGVHAEGLEALRRAVMSLGARCTIVAPATEQSQCGHRVTTHQPLRVEQRDADRYAVHGTPADCVRIALFALELKPNWVLSGINHGGNMGQDLVISGTVAAAREAAYHGFKAVALSHYITGGVPFDWPRMSTWCAEVLTWLWQPSQAIEHQFWNINFPHHPPGPRPLPTLRTVPPARSPLHVAFRAEPEGDAMLHHYTARYSERPQDEGSDVQACFGGDVAVSLISV